MIACLYDNFAHWAKSGSVYVFSDTHFHDSDCKFMDPHWVSVETQIDILNRFVHRCDTLVLLGDVGDLSCVDMLKAGRKVLIMGNHDKSIDACRAHFDEVYAGPVFIAPKIMLSHEPVSLPFCVNIHGHDHSNMETYSPGCKHLNVAANVCEYTPVNLGKLIKGGLLSDVPDIHRITIDAARERKKKKEADDYGEYVFYR